LYRLDGAKLNRAGTFIFDIKSISKLRPAEGVLPLSGFTLPKPPRFKRGITTSGLDVPTQRLQKFGGVKIIGFGEQTVRKAQGTLRVLVEQANRRAKDPFGFVTGLKIQVNALKRRKIKSPGTLSKIRRLQEAVKLLSSEQFIKLLESRVPRTKDFAAELRSIDVKKLKIVNNK